MIVWKSRKEADTSWKSPTTEISTVRKNRIDADTSWVENGRDKRKTKSRKYMLGSFFTAILTAIIDTKDGKAIRIKCDPAYIADSEFMSREEKNTERKVRFRS